ncbi:axe1 cleaves acetyl side chain groups acetyl xylan [Colletotrichum fioriniae PJ7]|uniref:Axe1 cleaves acetyl side chain groups acetyl xylan n=1 Tax=Colletotrichum fioriniae PJ7 TaxID=1445577 RepID=A0A010QXD0_9PEZI|nr:axe1 cleaves acetyl side chain groups acetyl xylan [Colletotrichum fioriniae PJ7]
MSLLVKAAAIACILPALVQGSKIPLTSRQTLNTTCADIHYFEARGTTLSYPGSLITVIDPLMEAFPNSNYEDIVYPATDESGSDSYFVGVRDGAKQIISYAEACPESKIVLMGYSQGAMVLGDILAGGGDGNILGNYTKPLVEARTVGDNIAAILLYGNPRHMPNQTYNVGNTSTFGATGKYPRTAGQLASLNVYANRVHDYCNYQDGVCDASGSNLTAHMAYPSDYDTQAIAWLESKLKAN